MDGASKFVRGDATAGILILVINMLGGLGIGMMAHDMSFGDAARVYTLLTIGDGLVAQIPALLLSTAVAIIVTRMSRAAGHGRRAGEAVVRSAARAGDRRGAARRDGPDPRHAELAVPADGGALRRRRVDASQALAASRSIRSRRRRRAAQPRRRSESRELTWEDVQPVDIIGLEVGYRLVPLVDKAQGGDLLARIRGVRRKLTQDLGFLVQAVHIRDNLDLPPNSYRINLAGVPVGEGVDLSGARARHQSGQGVRQARRASRRAIRRSAWKRCGSSRRRAITRRRSATRSSTRAP